MRCVRGEPGNATEGLFDALDHLVERLREPLQLVPASWNDQPLREIMVTDCS